MLKKLTCSVLAAFGLFGIGYFGKMAYDRKFGS